MLRKHGDRSNCTSAPCDSHEYFDYILYASAAHWAHVGRRMHSMYVRSWDVIAVSEALMLR